MAEVTVDHTALAANAALLARAVGPAALMAVVKADAFGHGVVEVARTALAHGATWLGVTSPREALEVRDAGFDVPVLAWLYGPGTGLDDVVRADVDLSVAAPWQLDAVADAAHRVGRPAQVHLKVDTGMSRNGAPAAEWPHLVALAGDLRRRRVLDVRGVWSHLANADVPDHPGVASQLQAFSEAVTVARAAGLDPAVRHLANSAAALQHPDCHFDLVRAGIALYGVEPVRGRRFGLRTAMTLQGRVILTKQISAGTGVSYGHDWQADRATTLALVPLGFADGVPRCVSGHAQVLVGGRRCPIVGRVSMDQIVVDIGDLPVAVGDPVVLFGPGEDGEPTVDDWAGWAGTNPHEIFTGIGTRVSRRHRPVVGALAGTR